MATITKRGPYQYRAEVRRKGVRLSETFETYDEASDWATVQEGKIVGGEYKGPNKADETTFLQAIEWYEGEVIPRAKADAKNKKVRARYWKVSDFEHWKMSAIMPWDLVDWRNVALDADNAEDGGQVGPDAIFGVQTCWHYLQFISHLFVEWCFAHRIRIENPVSKKVRPILDKGRDRRLELTKDDDGQNEEARLLKAVDASNSKWLGAATRIALETGMRQSELASLTWDRIDLEGEDPYADLPKTKNDHPRRVPLSKAAVAAFRTLPIGKGRQRVFGIETGRAVGHAFRGVIHDKDFPDLVWHDLRHEAISRLFEKTDFRDAEVMQVVGHLSRDSLERYTHLRVHKLARRLN